MSPGEPDRVVVWRVGDALLAAPLDAVVEIAPVAEDGRAVSRSGTLELRSHPGLAPPHNPRRAVIVRAAGTVVAMAADEVEGVSACSSHARSPAPDWLRPLATEHLAGLLRLDDSRIAALLAIDTLDRL